MKKYILIIIAVGYAALGNAQTTPTVLYNTDFSKGISPDFVNPGAWVKTKGGIMPTMKGLNTYLLLNRQYSINTRKLSVKVTLGSDTKLNLLTMELDRYHMLGTIIQADVKAGVLRIYKPYNVDNPVYPEVLTEHPYAFAAGHEYTLEMMRDYYKNKFIIIDNLTGVADTTVSPGQSSGLLRDGFAISNESGAAPIVKEFTVTTQFKPRIKVLFIGDSITEGLSSFPDAFSQHGTFAISGRSAGIVSGVQNRVLSEIAVLKPKYVSIMIGTNGFNTVENLTQVCTDILKLGVTPILNNIPWKTPASVVRDNEVIATVRKNLRLKGAAFDAATSVDGLNVQQDLTLYNKDGVHPNALGIQKMFERFKKDLPELFN
jgi:lysophospholipase L1-like esterase